MSTTEPATASPSVGVVLLIDSDPPSGHGDIGLYPPDPAGAPVDSEVFWRRHAATKEFVREVTPGAAVVTVHTSQRYRLEMLADPFVSAWHELVELGSDLALHPHEERADGSSLYGDTEHLTSVVAKFTASAASEGLSFAAFRSGFFAFSTELPGILAEHGIGVDLSAAAGLVVPERGVSWPAGLETAYRFPDEPRVLEIPLGWSGAGLDLSKDYLFNERQTLAGLKDVYEALRARALKTGVPQLVNLLCHGYGLAQPRYFDQLASLVEHIRSRDGALLDIASAKRFFDERFESATGRSAKGESERA